MFLINSCSPRLSETSRSSRSKSAHHKRHTFSRSYGVNLQSSLTRVLSSALGFSPHPPVSVYGTVYYSLKLRGFSWEPGINHFGPRGTSSSLLRINDPPDLPGGSPYELKQGTYPCWSSLLRHPIAVITGTGMLTCCPSTTPFGLALGTDSP